MKKLLFFDLETTGFANACGVHQLCLIIVINGEVHEILVHDVNPGDVAIYQDALDIGKKTIEEIRAHEDIATRMIEINKALSFLLDEDERWILCGFNNKRFDNRFWKTIYDRHCEEGIYSAIFSDTTLDVATMAKDYYKDKTEKPESFKLADIAKHMGVEVDASLLHTAKYDALITYELFKLFNNA